MKKLLLFLLLFSINTKVYATVTLVSGQNFNVKDNVSSLPGTFAGATTVGNTIACYVGWTAGSGGGSSTATLTSVTHGTDSLTLVAASKADLSGATNFDHIYVELAWKANIGDTTTNVTALTSSSSPMGMACFELHDGGGSGIQLDQTATAAVLKGGGGQPDAAVGPITTTQNGAYVISVVENNPTGFGGLDWYNTPSGFTSHNFATGGGNDETTSAWLAQTSAGSITATYVHMFAINTDYSAGLADFIPPGGGGGGTKPSGLPLLGVK